MCEKIPAKDNPASVVHPVDILGVLADAYCVSSGLPATSMAFG